IDRVMLAQAAGPIERRRHAAAPSRSGATARLPPTACAIPLTPRAIPRVRPAHSAPGRSPPRAGRTIRVPPPDADRAFRHALRPSGPGPPLAYHWGGSGITCERSPRKCRDDALHEARTTAPYRAASHQRRFHSMKALVTRFLREESGEDLIEYGLLCAF